MGNWKKVCGGILLFVSPIVVLLIWKTVSDSSLSRDPKYLIKPETRLKSFHRQWIKDFKDKPEYLQTRRYFRNFRAGHREIRIMEIPIPDQPRIYLVLRDEDFFSYTKTEPPWADSAELFTFSKWRDWVVPSTHKVSAPALESPGPAPLTRRYVISLFDADGRLADEQRPRPFGGNNVIDPDEYFFDMNKDGWVERVSSTNCGSRTEKGTVRTCSVTRVALPTIELFEVAYNIEDVANENWTHKCIDIDGDGIYEIAIGPENGAFESKVTFFWNSEANTYLAPAGEAGENFEVIKEWKQIDRILKTGKFAGAAKSGGE